ncbi:unknown [Clostridium sp. CAG:967]|nr:unknown [Clostridium sp. CAG:967]
MRKLFIIAVLMLAALPAFSIIPPDAAIIQVHDMQYIKDQKFRYQEYNDFKEVQEEKDKYNEKHTPTKPLIQKIFNKKSKFVEDNGEIKIEYEE